eukprot:m.351306 g.351306  ORF g.351306 m.351306 type:complete len:131 (-) comp16217_c0_seq1:45-437(-)
MKLELCSFSGYKIHPGHGRTMVKADGKTFFFMSSKAESLFFQRKNPRKIAWTVLYRRKHKKGIAAAATKKRTRRTQQFARTIEGIDKDKLLALKNQTAAERENMRKEAIRKAKLKKSAKAAPKGKGKGKK